MQLYKKINNLIKAKHGNLSHFHRALKKIFKKDSIAYLTLYRTATGKTEVRESTLFQIATTLDLPTEEILKQTERPPCPTLFHYNKKAFMEILNGPPNILTAKLMLLPNASTRPQQDPKEKGNFTKWLFVLSGEITCVVLNPAQVTKTTLKKGETFFFDSTDPHYFENVCGKKSICLLIQNPKYI